MRWKCLMLAFIPLSFSVMCPKACSSHVECVSTDGSFLCCTAGLCQKAKLLPDGAACSIGRTQDQVCAAEGGGECAAGPGVVVGLVALTGGESPDSLCINNVCRFESPSQLQTDAGCTCSDSEQCESGAVCAGTCVDSSKKVGEACAAHAQCTDNPVCEQGICQGLGLGAKCEYDLCIGNGCSDACAKPYQCLNSSNTCGVPIDEGATCSQQGDCKVGLWCWFGKCSKGASAGQNCSAALMPSLALPTCVGGLFCDVLASTPICSAAYTRPGGQTCVNHYECQSRSCRGVGLGPRTCFGGQVAGEACESTGTADCGENHNCDCASRKCVNIDTSQVCFAEATAYGQVLSNAVKGVLVDNAMEIALDFVCCRGCKMGDYTSLRTVDCSTRKVSPAADPCTNHSKAVLTGCSAWAPKQWTPRSRESYSGGSALSVAFGLVLVFISV